MHWKSVRNTAFCAWLAVPAFAQQSAVSQQTNAICTFQDGKQTRVSYSPVTELAKKDLPRDRLWTPGSQPMMLYLTAPVTLVGLPLSPGAYSMYFVPGKDKWRIIVNKDITPGHEYDPSQDLVRAPMEIAQLPTTQKFQLAFARTQPTQCSLRIYFEKTGIWVEFNEQ